MFGVASVVFTLGECTLLSDDMPDAAAGPDGKDDEGRRDGAWLRRASALDDGDDLAGDSATCVAFNGKHARWGFTTCPLELTVQGLGFRVYAPRATT